MLRTFFYTGLVAALAIPMVVMSVINITIGSKWRVALRRAKLAGQLLARMLMQGLHGERPVTLVGFSMGARLIFHCGLELARHGAAGLLEHVVLLGTPVSLRPERWAALRSVVAGRVINGYSNNDWTLGIVYRAHSGSSMIRHAAGLVDVRLPGIESVDLSALVDSHAGYLQRMDEVLRAVGFSDEM